MQENKLTPEQIASMSEVQNKQKMEKKTFSMKDGSMIIHNGHIVLWHNPHIHIASTNNCDDTEYLLPTTLIRKQKSDEELAEEDWQYLFGSGFDEKSFFEGHLCGRKSFGDKEFHLTREDVLELLQDAINYGCNRDINDKEYIYAVITSLTPTTYPHTIEVMHDGNNYLWETTLNAIY
jgi:hypothetical protein